MHGYIWPTIPVKLVDYGYDVWLGNNNGVLYSNSNDRDDFTGTDGGDTVIDYKVEMNDNNARVLKKFRHCVASTKVLEY